MKDECSYRNFFSFSTGTSIPVECPECGAVRLLDVGHAGECARFPWHKRMGGKARHRKHLKLFFGEWKIVEN